MTRGYSCRSGMVAPGPPAILRPLPRGLRRVMGLRHGRGSRGRSRGHARVSLCGRAPSRPLLVPRSASPGTVCACALGVQSGTPHDLPLGALPPPHSRGWLGTVRFFSAFVGPREPPSRRGTAQGMREGRPGTGKRPGAEERAGQGVGMDGRAPPRLLREGQRTCLAWTAGAGTVAGPRAGAATTGAAVPVGAAALPTRPVTA